MKKSRKDFWRAESVLTLDPPDTEDCLFHCQQAVEKSLKDSWFGGTNHFGSPFNFPEEFVSVYRLHPLVPDLLEFRDLGNDPNVIRSKVPMIDTFRGKATSKMHEGGLASWALTMGRQRLGALALRNHPQFLQNLDLRPRMDGKIDRVALEDIRKNRRPRR